MKSRLGYELERTQVFTPHEVATYLVDLAMESHLASLTALDPGAGAGALSEALALKARATGVNAHIVSVELDEILAAHLSDTANEFAGEGIDWTVHKGNFIELAQQWFHDSWRIDAVVMNPPYSRYSRSVSGAQPMTISPPNVYGVFLLLGAQLLKPGGVLVALVPRSFFNGRNFAALRRAMGQLCSITAIHSFERRDAVFGRDKVLQESVIVRYERDSPSSRQISLSWSDGPLLHSPLHRVYVDRARIQDPSDRDFVVHVPRNPDDSLVPPTWDDPEATTLLQDFDVSNGPVVDFRVQGGLSAEAGPGSIRVVGSEIFAASGSSRSGRRYLPPDQAGRHRVFPPGYYVVVKRISPKEQIPRLKAILFEALGEGFENGVTFENHVNFIHQGFCPLNHADAELLVKRLASAEVERQFGERSGSTQVNVSDLRGLFWSPLFES